MQKGFGDVSTLIFPFFSQVYYPVTSSYGLGNFVIYGATASATSVIDASDYNNFVFQPSNSGSGTSTMTISSSVDGLNWVGESAFSMVSQTASIYRPSITGRRRYFLASFSGTGTATGSLYLLAGQ